MYEHDYNKNPELSDAQLEMLQFSSPHQQITEDFNAIVVKVHDGDTITLQTTFRDFNFPLRFLDIDAPEMSEGGDIAKEWLTNRLLGEHIKVEINKKNRVGKYGFFPETIPDIFWYHRAVSGILPNEIIKPDNNQ